MVSTRSQVMSSILCATFVGCGQADSQTRPFDYNATQSAIKVGTAQAIVVHCDGLRLSKEMQGKEMQAEYDKLEELPVEDTRFKLMLSAADDAEDRYGLLAGSEGCSKALSDWGPQSADALVERDN